MFSQDHPPERCGSGHRLEPRRVLVGFAPCFCDRVPGRSRGHLTWTCRVCGEILYADGHVDDAQLTHPPPQLPASLHLED